MSAALRLMRRYDVALLDLDGVVYAGENALDHAPQAVKAARGAGMRMAFVTNNASRPPNVVAAHLTDLGVAAGPHEVVSSAQAAVGLLAELVPAGSRVLLVGGEGLDVALRERGLVPVTSHDAEPSAVVQGFGPEVDWRILAEGAYAVASGLPWVASNLDPTFPTARGLAPGNGTLVDAIRVATGREPVVAGKPERAMHHEAIARTGARHPLVVGDRLDTDIQGANAAGVDSLLVLTGVTSPTELVLARPPRQPTYIGHDLRALAARSDEVQVSIGSRRYGRWTGTVERGQLQLEAHGTAAPLGPEIDAVRVACAVAWAAEQPMDAASVSAALAAAGWH